MKKVNELKLRETLLLELREEAESKKKEIEKFFSKMNLKEVEELYSKFLI